MSTLKKILFIINPISGVGKKNTIPPLIGDYLPTNQFSWDIRYTEKRKHGAEIAFAEKGNYDAIVAVGGDGSVNEIGSALIHEDCALGIIPCGSGNGLARHLHIPLKVVGALQRIATFEPFSIDTGLVNDQPFLGTCGFGFDAHVANKFDSFGKRGFLSYARLVIREYNRYELPTFQISGSDVDIKKEAVMCSIANSSQFGNGFTISPNSDIQDGIFELVLLDRFGWVKAPAISRKFFSKSIQTSKYFSSVAFKEDLEITIHNSEHVNYHIDGEPLQGNGKFKITIRPKSLTIL
ncbi:MAG: diacylglycerol kinase family protein [Crocinitomix sp.]|nr:diacylglycerol kinase family protein [Crocinitomix sp.]